MHLCKYISTFGYVAKYPRILSEQAIPGFVAKTGRPVVCLVGNGE